MEPQLTVTIINNNNPEMILACIKSVYDTTQGMTIEVIVVDNVSGDGSLGEIRARFPDVIIIENAVKEGFSANHNKAMRVSTGRYILILNDDTIVHEGALNAMVSFMEANPQAGAVGGMLLNADGTHQYTGKATPTIMAAILISLGFHKVFPNNPITSKYFHKKETYSEVEEVEGINGAALMIRREVLDRVGFLDEGFFLYCEDVDWCIRMRETGYRLYFLPGAVITHYRGSSGKGSARIIRIYHESLLRFYNKHHAAKHIFIVNWLVWLGIKVRLVISLIRGRVR